MTAAPQFSVTIGGYRLKNVNLGAGMKQRARGCNPLGARLTADIVNGTGPGYWSWDRPWRILDSWHTPHRIPYPSVV